jgi:hypothetical protein
MDSCQRNIRAIHCHKLQVKKFEIKSSNHHHKPPLERINRKVDVDQSIQEIMETEMSINEELPDCAGFRRGNQ